LSPAVTASKVSSESIGLFQMSFAVAAGASEVVDIRRLGG
jgi:hypothetical protein